MEAGKETPAIFEALEVEDIRTAADLFRPIYDSTEGRDGFVSIEVAPTLARDTQGTIAEARRLWAEVDRPNILVKVPGTREGLPAIEQLLGEGININITLLFAIERYEEVALAYLAALEKLAREGKPLNRIASVASFFVSRIDTMADQQLEAKLAAAKSAEEKQRLESLLGKTAIANAKLAYVKFKEIFSSSRFQALAKKGARVQRMLWASTGTKNPKYSDTLYVDTLVGPDSVNTMPAATLEAYRDHGKPALRIEDGVAEARSVMQQLSEVGVDLGAITGKIGRPGRGFLYQGLPKAAGVDCRKAQEVFACAARAACGNDELVAGGHQRGAWTNWTRSTLAAVYGIVTPRYGSRIPATRK